MALNLLSIFNTNNCKVNVVTLKWTSPSVFLNEVCDLFPGRELFNSKWRLLWKLKLSDEKIPENSQMSQTLWIRRKSLLSHHPAFSTGICQHQTAFPSTLPSMEIDDEEGWFSTIRLQALRKVLINGKAQSIKYKSSQCEISSTN